MNTKPITAPPGLWSARRAAILAAVLACAGMLAIPVCGQQGSGVIEGKLVNATDPAKVPAGVELDAVGLGGGMSVLKSSKSDAAGKFRFDGIPTDSPVMIRANYKTVNYHSMVNFGGSAKAQVDVEVFEPTTSPKSVKLEGLQMAFQLTGDQLRCLESYTFKNETRPPQTFMVADGNFRFSKAPGILEPPGLNVVAPGSSMPLTQSPMESPDGQSYYSLYPLRPGTTTFQVEQALPYKDKTYTFRKKFYNDVESFQFGVIPQDVKVEGQGLVRLQAGADKNFAVYSGGPVKMGTEVVWTFSGGTPVAPGAMSGETSGAGSGEAKVRPMGNAVSQNALVIGPLILLGFVVMLWYGYSRIAGAEPAQDPRNKELQARREQLLNHLAALDKRFEAENLNRGEYTRQRDLGKRQLRRIAMLLSNKK
jgi:hypothetical protein